MVNVGDPYGRRLAAEIDGVRARSRSTPPADYSATDLRCDFAGCRFALRTPAGERAVVRCRCRGASTSPTRSARSPPRTRSAASSTRWSHALERGVRVPGRFEPVDEGQDFAVLVDYAHTPDSLENVLDAARELVAAGERAGGRVVCVFGAGGDRDRGKRPLMGEIAARLADVRGRDLRQPALGGPGADHRRDHGRRARARAPRASGAGAAPSVRSVADRAGRSTRRSRRRRPGDVLVIAGKGHEQGQEFADGRKVPFDDVAVAREALRAAQARA